MIIGEILVAVFVLTGLNTTIWAFFGIVRHVHEDWIVRIRKRNKLRKIGDHSILPFEVAALVPAHNEESTLEGTIQSLKNIMPIENIHIASDGSSDRTVEIAKELGCNVVDINPNRGKAGAIAYALKHFNLYDTYKAVLIVDADTQIGPDYLKEGLLYFDDPDVVALAGHAITKWENHWKPSLGMFFVAYRVRLYRVLQAMFRYGQTWKYTNVSPIIPGFASVYRTSILKKIDITAKGLVIEDYNMTFEVHHKRLGKIAYHPYAYGVCQDPYTFKDYVKQVDRWNLGFWQTVKRHGFWPSMFSIFLILFIFEMLAFSLIFMFIPFVFEWFILNNFAPFTYHFSLIGLQDFRVDMLDVIFGIFIVDYAITVAVALADKKPMLLFYGIGFLFLRFIDAYIYLTSLPIAFFKKSSGAWTSPKRRVS